MYDRLEHGRSLKDRATQEPLKILQVSVLDIFLSQIQVSSSADPWTQNFGNIGRVREVNHSGYPRMLLFSVAVLAVPSANLFPMWLGT